MSTAARIDALAAHVAAETGFSVYSSADLSTGRGDLWIYVGPPVYQFDDAAQTLCRPGREPRLAASVVVVGPGTAPGQLAALYGGADQVLAALMTVPGWAPAGDGSPFEYQNVPAYEFPLITI
jgi:hypothetical protein